MPRTAPDYDKDDTVSDLSFEALKEMSALAPPSERVTVTAAPEDGDETVSLAVTHEHPGRYTGPRRGGQETSDPIELGRGGIGRVLIAHDAHLGREVAVKELLHRADGPLGSRASTNPRESLAAARFLREARLTGQLEHPNIVPVYELGTRADGTLYYTMKVVRGRNLASALESVRGDGLAARMKFLSHYANLCDAIAYAHSRGVIHRDVKPENVMVGEFGETVVLDWGLAKPRNAKDLRGDEAAVAEDGAMAATAVAARPVSATHDTHDEGRGLAATDDGTLLGTPMYMSPEQAQGDLAAIDERSDVWALGIVLYEILVGDVPFNGKTAVELLLKIVAGTYTPVTTACPEAPPELAAIAEKAISRNPNYRYPDARAMAEEVRAYLTGGRVQAYNYRPWTLVKRWAGKHKAALVVAALGLVALLVLGVVSYVQIANERDRAKLAEGEAVTSMRAATSARERAEAAETAARRSRDSAEGLVRYMVSDLKDRLEPLGQLALLGDVANAIDKHYDDTAGVVTAAGMAEPEMEDAARVRNRAAVTALMGDVARARGDLVAAGAAYDKAEVLRTALLAKGDSPDYRLDRAESYRQRGLLLRMRGDLTAARAELDKARLIRSELFAQYPERLPIQRARVQSELDEGDMAALLGDLPKAEAAFASAVVMARDLVTKAVEPGLNERARFDLSVALDGVGTTLLDMQRLDAARAAFDEALELRRVLLEKRPSNLDWRHRMATSHARLGEIDEAQGQDEAALKHWQRAAGSMERLVRADPENARWARDLAVNLNHLGDLQLRAGQHEAAVKSFTKALEQLEDLAERDASNVELARDVEVAHNRLGQAALAMANLPVALASFQKGFELADRLATKDASNTQWQHDLAHVLVRLAVTRARAGELAVAKPLAARAVAILEALVARDASNAAWQHDLLGVRELVIDLAAGRLVNVENPTDQHQRPAEMKLKLKPQVQRSQPAADDEYVQPQPQRPEASPASDKVEPPPKEP